jgi:hypothetical protein
MFRHGYYWNMSTFLSNFSLLLYNYGIYHFLQGEHSRDSFEKAF